ncbi:sensor histidine kinase [Pontiella agarivorans]|uniref:histidine kinase n=1 Tax=Pontiella agarivorans TaxID=3038953 RepID=A0ABU5MTX3_9BACT|nr:sensor histidine kinase [Pontiella agarivorans]MDZ8117541.1 sensor histidine kinase [Pontiella agarivorans]
MRRLFTVFKLILLMLSGIGTVDAQQVYTNLTSLRALPLEKASQKLPVRVEAQVMWIHATGNGLFLHDGKRGIYAQKPGAAGALSRFVPGDIVRVEGKTNEGFFSTSIFVDRIERLGNKPLPEARPFYTFELYSTQIDCDWVWLAGRIISKSVQMDGSSGRSLTLELMVNSVPVHVQMPWTEEVEKQVDELMFSRVKFNAVAGTQFNMNRQVVGRTFFVNTPDQFELIDNFKPGEGIAILPIHELMRAGDAHHRLPKGTKGMVTYVSDSHLYLRGEKACIKVMTRGRAEVAAGDCIEVEGVVLPNPISPDFAAREIRLVERTGRLPEPIPLTLNDELRARWDNFPEASLNYELVKLDAELVDITESFGLTTGHREKILLCRQGSYLFEAKIPHYAELSEDLKPGAIIRLQGICNLTRSEERSWRLYVDWFWLQLRWASDVAVLSPAPWWTPGRLLWMLGAGSGLTMLILVWVAALRRTVRKQTGVIADQVERETISDERQRIARELHDNLEQGLAGMAIQLRGAQRVLELNREKRLSSIRTLLKRVGTEQKGIREHLKQEAEEVISDSDRNRHAIEVVQGMLAHCSQESRSSIMDLRGGILERLDFISALKETLEPLARGGGATFELKVTGEVRKLNQAAERNLLLIVKEAVANATEHAGPETVTVELDYRNDSLIIRIMDDGAGFEPACASKAGHFGLLGMQERVNQLKGMLEIESRPGEGTCVKIHISSTMEWEPA